jgi:hypothetical protein
VVDVVFLTPLLRLVVAHKLVEHCTHARTHTKVRFG